MSGGTIVHVAWRGRQVVLRGEAPKSETTAFREALRVAINGSHSYLRLSLAIHATATEWGYVARLPDTEPEGAEILVALQPAPRR